jgi:hypothetical protein
MNDMNPDPMRHPRLPAGADPRAVVADLARQTERPIEEVERVYSRQLEELEAYATVLAYVPLFAKRRARDILRRH